MSQVTHLRQAIVTTYLEPTNTKGSRVKAMAQAGRYTMSWDHALDEHQNHEKCARLLAASLGWQHDATLAGGCIEQNHYCWVLISHAQAKELVKITESRKMPGYISEPRAKGLHR